MTNRYDFDFGGISGSRNQHVVPFEPTGAVRRIHDPHPAVFLRQ